MSNVSSHATLGYFRAITNQSREILFDCYERPETSVLCQEHSQAPLYFGRLAELLRRTITAFRLQAFLDDSRDIALSKTTLCCISMAGRSGVQRFWSKQVETQRPTLSTYIRLFRTSHETNHGRTQQTARGLPHGWSMVTPSSLAAQSLTS